MSSFLLQASGTFKFPDLFPNQDVKDQESAQKQADTTPQETEPLRWFWRQEALQESIYEVSYQSLASPEWHWSEENGTLIVLHPSCGRVTSLPFWIERSWTWWLVSGVWGWSLTTKTADKQKKSKHSGRQHHSHMYIETTGCILSR